MSVFRDKFFEKMGFYFKYWYLYTVQYVQSQSPSLILFLRKILILNHKIEFA
jgi:hypothetical protein